MNTGKSMEKIVIEVLKVFDNYGMMNDTQVTISAVISETKHEVSFIAYDYKTERARVVVGYFDMLVMSAEDIAKNVLEFWYKQIYGDMWGMICHRLKEVTTWRV